MKDWPCLEIRGDLVVMQREDNICSWVEEMQKVSPKACHGWPPHGLGAQHAFCFGEKRYNDKREDGATET